jgi:hypothetical protein
MRWKIRAEAPTICDECKADTEFWEQHRYDFDYEAIENRAQAILIAEYDRRFGSNAWAASGNKFPEHLMYYTRPQLADKVYELRHGHPLPKIEWGMLLGAAVSTGIFVAMFAYDWRKHPEQADFHGFRLVVTLLIIALLPAGFLWAALKHFYPLRERRLDKLIAWHAKSFVFIMLCCVFVAIALISGGAVGLGWLLAAAAVAYAIWYGVLAVVAGEARALGYFWVATDFVWDAVGNAIWYVAGVVKRSWKIRAGK